MASVRKRKRSPFWYACVRLPDGQPRHFSTGLTDKAEALALAVSTERTMRKGAATPHQLRAALDRLADEFVPREEEDPGVWLVAWAAARKREVGASTATAYTQTAKEAAEWLAAAGVLTFSALTPAMVTALRNHWAEAASPVSANKKIKHLKAALADAVKAKRIEENPAASVSRLREDKTARREFRQAELDRLLPTLTGEWQAITLLGLYTGQRLNDLAVLTWDAIDLETKTIRFTAAKTGALVALPILAPAADALATLPRKGNKVFPKVAATAQSSRSNAFRGLLAKVGLANDRNARNAEKPGSGRTTSELSFHSLRHTTTTMLKAAGVSDAVARAIVGHESKAVSASYTHLDLETMRAAMVKLPGAGDQPQAGQSHP